MHDARERWGERRVHAPSEPAAPRISSTREGGTRTPSTWTPELAFLPLVGLDGCDEPATAAMAEAAGTVGLLAPAEPFTTPVASWPDTTAGEGLLFLAAAA